MRSSDLLSYADLRRPARLKAHCGRAPSFQCQRVERRRYVVLRVRIDPVVPVAKEAIRRRCVVYTDVVVGNDGTAQLDSHLRTSKVDGDDAGTKIATNDCIVDRHCHYRRHPAIKLNSVTVVATCDAIGNIDVCRAAAYSGRVHVNAYAIADRCNMVDHAI